MEATHSQLLAEGELNWAKSERVSDRYGSVNIQVGGELVRTLEDLSKDLPSEYANFQDAPIGRLGRLVAEVTVARDSFHIGDLTRGIGPETPDVGERIILGEGELFVESYDGTPSIGVRPEDKREVAWMDIPSLYRAHTQTVKLYFELEATLEQIQ